MTILAEPATKKFHADRRHERGLYWGPDLVLGALHLLEHGIWTQAPRLLRVELPPGLLRGLRIGDRIPSGLGGERQIRAADLELDGYDGVHVVGYGTTVIGPGGTSPILISADVPYVLLEGMGIEGGEGAYSIHADIDAVGHGGPRKSIVHLREIDERPAPVGQRSITSGMWYAATIIREFCNTDWAGARQHPNYHHNVGPYGAVYRHCRIHGGGEPGKFTCRPHARYYQPPHTERDWVAEHPEWFERPVGQYRHAYEDGSHRFHGLPLPGGRGKVVIVEDCYVTGWDQPGGDYGGAGWSIQGPGGDVHFRIKRSVFAHPANGSGNGKMAFGSYPSFEYFDEKGIASAEEGRSPWSCGSVEFEDCILQSPVEPQSWSDHPGPLVNARQLTSLAFRRCGLFGWGGYVEAKILRDALLVEGCNTEREIEFARARLGLDEFVLGNPPIYGPDAVGAVSEGYEWKAKP